MDREKKQKMRGWNEKGKNEEGKETNWGMSKKLSRNEWFGGNEKEVEIRSVKRECSQEK